MVTRDTHQRCVVCGRTPSEPCCTQCHRAHDYAWAHPTWSISSNGGRIVPARELAKALR